MKLRSGVDSSQPVQAPLKTTNETKTGGPLQKKVRIEGKVSQSKADAATKDKTGDSSVSSANTAVTKADKKSRKKQRGKKRKSKAFLASLAAEIHNLDDQSISNYPSLPGKWPKTPPQSHTRSSGNEAPVSSSQTTWTDPSLPGKWPKTPPQQSIHRGYNKASTGASNVARPNNKNFNGSRSDVRLPNNAQVSIPRNSSHKGFFKPNFAPGERVTAEQLEDIKNTFKTIRDELVAVALIMNNISGSDVALKEDLSNMVWQMYFAYNAAQSINDNYLHPRRS